MIGKSFYKIVFLCGLSIFLAVLTVCAACNPAGNWQHGIKMNARKKLYSSSYKKQTKTSSYRLTRYRGFMSPQTFNEADFASLANEYNANLVRWQLDAIGEWGLKLQSNDSAVYNQWLEYKLQELDKALVAAAKYKIKIVVDLHSPPGGRYADDNSMVMLYEKKYNDEFLDVWKKIAARYKGNTMVWGYDLVNEPVQVKPTPEGLDYVSTQTRVAKAIREIDPKTAIIFESGDWDRASEYANFKPLPLNNIIYEAHMYDPIKFTHQGIGNTFTDVQYPGIIGGKEYNKDALKALLEPLRQFQLANNAHIYIGEFSAVRWAPGAADYLKDCISIFEEYGWDWTYHAFREADVWNIEDENWPLNQSKQSVVTSKTSTDRKQAIMSGLNSNKISSQ